MNKIEALIKTRNHWYILEITGDYDKGIYGPAYDWEHKCACCQFVYDTTKIYPGYEGDPSKDLDYIPECSAFCPLTGYAWGENGCLNPNSPYSKWENGPNNYDHHNIEERRKYAREMLYYINLAITDYYTKQSS